MPHECGRGREREVRAMGREITLDVRGMEPPEPLERVLETIDDFVPGDRLKLVIDCRPMPLFRILERNGYAHHEAAGANSNYEITIWRKPAAGGQ
jgi:TusA-related sulfurtransferase